MFMGVSNTEPEVNSKDTVALAAAGDSARRGEKCSTAVLEWVVARRTVNSFAVRPCSLWELAGSKPRVPAVYLSLAFLALSAVVAICRINNLQPVKVARGFDSPRLHHQPGPVGTVPSHSGNPMHHVNRLFDSHLPAQNT